MKTDTVKNHESIRKKNLVKEDFESKLTELSLTVALNTLNKLKEDTELCY